MASTKANTNLQKRFEHCRKLLGMTKREYSIRFGVPLATVEGWGCSNPKKQPKEYYVILLEQYLLQKGLI